MRIRTLLVGAIVAIAASTAASPAMAAKSSGRTDANFTLTTAAGRVVTSDTKLAAKDLAGGRITVRGRYVDFDVDPSTLAAYNYTLTGAPSPEDLTGGRRLPLFASKVPSLAAPLSSELSVKQKDGTLELIRSGGGTKMKIQAKDAATGGIFQMEPEAAQNVIITHTLAPGMFYFVNPFTGKVNFGNGTNFRGKDSPQVATRLLQTDTVTRWSVAPGGRLGGVLGEDAVELSAGPTVCTSDCQAQNQIRGSLPVTDPAFSG